MAGWIKNHMFMESNKLLSLRAKRGSLGARIRSHGWPRYARHDEMHGWQRCAFHDGRYRELSYRALADWLQAPAL